jgi:hypothetical protein
MLAGSFVGCLMSRKLEREGWGILIFEMMRRGLAAKRRRGRKNGEGQEPRITRKTRMKSNLEE